MEEEPPPTSAAASSPSSGGAARNHIQNHHHELKRITQSHVHHHHHRGIISSTFPLIIVISIVIVILLVAIVLLIVMLRRVRFSQGKSSGASTCSVAKSKTSVINNNNCMFVAHSTINMFHSSPAEVNGGRGCLYGSNVEPKLRGVQVFTLKEVETATNKLSEANLVGNDGALYRGVLRDGTLAAIKLLRPHGIHRERAFRSQVDLLSRLRSPYIVELLGYCADQQHRILIFEYLSNGSLQKHLHSRSNQNRTLNWGIRLNIAFDCARALEYIHEHTTPTVIHRNLKCSNILLDQNFRAKLSGFGLAKIGSDKLHGLISTRVLGTTGYLAPEYASTGKLTTKSDVYSYGVILLELLTGRVPIDTTRPPGEHILVSWSNLLNASSRRKCFLYVLCHNAFILYCLSRVFWSFYLAYRSISAVDWPSCEALPHLTNRDKVMEMIDPTLEGQYDKKDLIQVAAIAAMCVQTEAEYRPLMTDVVQSLIPLVKNLSVPCLSNSLRSNQSTSPMSYSCLVQKKPQK